MKLTQLAITTSVLAAFWLVPAASFAATPAASMAAPMMSTSATAASRDATNLMKKINERADQAVASADGLVYQQLPSFDEWQHQLTEINAVKTNVNQIGKDFHALQALRSELPMWQQVAIDRLRPKLESLARNTTDTIEYLNSNQTGLWRPAIRRYESAIDREAQSVSTLSDQFVDYARVQRQDKNLTDSLGIGTSS